MRRTLVTITGMIVLLVIAYLGYDLLIRALSPCDAVFEQTSVQLGTKLEVVQTQGAVFIGREKIQDLTEAAQVTALNLKTCCIVLNAGKVDSNQFLQCKNTAKEYETKVDTVISQIEGAEKAQAEGKADVVEKAVGQIKATIREAEDLSAELQGRVATLSPADGAPTQPATGKTSAAEPSPPAQPAVGRTAAAESSLQLATVLRQGAEAVERDLRYDVYDAKQDLEGRRQSVIYSFDAAPLLKLPPGRYYVTVQHGSAGAATEVEVTPRATTAVTLVLNAGYLRLASLAAEGGEPLENELKYQVLGAPDLEGQRKEITYSFAARPLFRLPAGRYVVAVTHGNAAASADVTVEPGELTEQTVVLNAGYLRLSAVAAGSSEALTKNLKYQVYEAKKDLDGQRREISYSYAASPLFRLPAGEYYVTVERGSARATAEVQIEAGRLRESTLQVAVE